MPDLEQRFEGCVLEAYPDPVWHGVTRTPANDKHWGHPWTIGYGHTGPDVYEGLVWTQQQADEQLAKDEAKARKAVLSFVHSDEHLNADEIKACEDFVFNLGAAAFRSSTLLRKLNLGDLAGAAEEFHKWDHAGGKVLAGLLKRRQAEAHLFLAGMNEG